MTGDDSTPVYVFRVGGSISSNEMQELSKAISEAMGDVESSGGFVFLPEDIEPISKDELIDELERMG